MDTHVGRFWDTKDFFLIVSKTVLDTALQLPLLDVLADTQADSRPSFGKHP